MLLALGLVLCFVSLSAQAQRASLRTYGEADGLSDLDVSCLQQDAAGDLFACTSNGIFIYAGRRFLSLGPEQGLPDGGSVSDVAFTPDDRVIVRFDTDIFVSDAAINKFRPPQALHFSSVAIPVGTFLHDETVQMTPWRNGAAVLVKSRVAFVDVTDPASPRLTPIGLPLRGADPLSQPITLASTGDRLWASYADGLVCSFVDRHTRCYGRGDGLIGGPWYALLATKAGTIIARSTNALATIDPRSGQVTIEHLPFQGESAGFATRLRVVQLASGALVTQSDDGFLVQQAAGWKQVSTADGLTDARLSALLVDHEGSLWFAAGGHGVYRVFGYGNWENRDHRDGLTDDTIWQVVRQPGGPLWVATDRGVDAVGAGGMAIAHSHYRGYAFAIGMGAPTHLWRTNGVKGLSCIDVTTGAIEHFDLPAANMILHGAGSRVWFATQGGIYFVDDAPGPSRRIQKLPGTGAPVLSVAPDSDGSLWYVSQQSLMHWRTDGSVEQVVAKWPNPAFEPVALALGATGEVWVGGPGGGVYLVSLSDHRPPRLQNYASPTILSNSVTSILVDRRGWVWAATDRGLSVFNRDKWRSVNADAGLVWNDTSQDGLYEDVDGSIWISTSQGLSHLTDPTTLFRSDAINVVISSLTLGSQQYPIASVDYTTSPLAVAFGTSNFQAERSIVFRYRLDGVDADWVTTQSGYARYPFVPSGHHRLTVTAVDTLTGQSSPPVSFTIRIRRAWWASWPAWLAYLLLALLIVVMSFRLRYHAVLQRQAVLERTVQVRTEEIRVAKEALMLQATRDSLTGLLNRGEIQKRFIAMLERSGDAERLVAGLVDVDHFKRVNDMHGHLVGDEILIGISEQIRQMLRPGECAGRYGGEEMLILLADDDQSAKARILALNEAIRTKPFVALGREIAVTCSIGVGRAQAGDGWESLIGRIDEALYQAKHSGRDQVIEAERRLTRRAS